MWMKNNVDPDQVSESKPSDLDLHFSKEGINI